MSPADTRPVSVDEPAPLVSAPSLSDMRLADDDAAPAAAGVPLADDRRSSAPAEQFDLSTAAHAGPQGPARRVMFSPDVKTPRVTMRFRRTVSVDSGSSIMPADSAGTHSFFGGGVVHSQMSSSPGNASTMGHTGVMHSPASFAGTHSSGTYAVSAGGGGGCSIMGGGASSMMGGPAQSLPQPGTREHAAYLQQIAAAQREVQAGGQQVHAPWQQAQMHMQPQCQQQGCGLQQQQQQQGMVQGLPVPAGQQSPAHAHYQPQMYDQQGQQHMMGPMSQMLMPPQQTPQQQQQQQHQQMMMAAYQQQLAGQMQYMMGSYQTKYGKQVPKVPKNGMNVVGGMPMGQYPGGHAAAPMPGAHSAAQSQRKPQSVGNHKRRHSRQKAANVSCTRSGSAQHTPDKPQRKSSSSKTPAKAQAAPPVHKAHYMSGAPGSMPNMPMPVGMWSPQQQLPANVQRSMSGSGPTVHHRSTLQNASGGQSISRTNSSSTVQRSDSARHAQHIWRQSSGATDMPRAGSLGVLRQPSSGVPPVPGGSGAHSGRTVPSSAAVSVVGQQVRFSISQ